MARVNLDNYFIFAEVKRYLRLGRDEGRHQTVLQAFVQFCYCVLNIAKKKCDLQLAAFWLCSTHLVVLRPRYWAP